MKYKDMNLKMERFTKDSVYNKENMVSLSKEFKPCINCGESTNFVDICSESHICGPDCSREFYGKVGNISMNPDNPAFYPSE